MNMNNTRDPLMDGMAMRGSDKDAGASEKKCKASDRKLSANVMIMNYHHDGTPFWNDLYICQADRSNR